jgi:hypothetical protein
LRKKKLIPISIVIPTLGNNHIITTLRYILKSNVRPYEVILVIPKTYKDKLNFLKFFKKFNYKIILTKKKNQVYQRIKGFKKSKKNFVVQMDDDILVKKDCLLNLFRQITSYKENVAIAPKYLSNTKLSSVYKKPKSRLLKIYHWLINSNNGFNPGSISLSGFNYSDEFGKKGTREHEWLSGGIIIHKKKNLILENYYPYNFNKSYCEDILHSILLRKKKVRLLKYYETSVKEISQGNIVNQKLIKTLEGFYAELLIRFYIVSKFNLSKMRFVIYYFIFFLRIMIKNFKS